MNWGKGIFISFVVFAVLLAFLVYKTTEVTSEMVTDNYYEKEVEYNDIYKGKTNVLNLEVNPKVEVKNSNIIIGYPAESISQDMEGEVYFYSINNVSRDKRYTIKVDSNNQQIFSKDIFSTGNYNLQLKWVSNGKNYFFDKNIYIP